MTAKPLPIRRRRWPWAVLSLLVLLATGHALLWHWAAGQMQAQMDHWVAIRRAQGWQVSHGRPERGGWPLAVTLRLPEFRLEGGDATLPGGIAWQAEALLLQVQAPRLGQLVVAAIGPQRLRLEALELPFIADRLTATVPIERDALPREALLQADRLRLGTGDGSVTVRQARAQVTTDAAATAAQPAVSLDARAEEIALPPSPATAALGRMLQSASLRAGLTGPVPPPLGPAPRATAWRDGGGTLALQDLALAWGPVQAQASAMLRLDAALQPAGSGTLHLQGAEPALDAAAAAGLVPARNLGALRTVLRLMQRPGPDGRPLLEVPLTLENRNLGVARITLLRLPPLQWTD